LITRPPEFNAKSLIGIAEGLNLVIISANEVLVQFGTRSRPSELLRDNDLTGELGKAIARLVQAPATVEELLLQTNPTNVPAMHSLLADLLARGIVADLRSNPIEQYLRYTFEGETYLPNSRVLLIGSGPLGARIAQNFLQHGIGTLTLLDERPVDALWGALIPFGRGSRSNGERADVALRELLAIPVRCLQTGLDAAGVETAIEDSDFLVLALEQPDLRLAHLVNRFAIRHRKPWLIATIDGNLGLVGPLFHPVETACYNDYQTLVMAATPSPDIARKHRETMVNRTSRSFFVGLPSYAEIIAGHASLALVHFLLRGSCFALGRVMVIDFDRMRIDVEDVLKLPRCPVCGTHKSPYRPAFSS
jgi:bacteriocin biosynthesis cyclodehydratase domain-containing protein